MSDAVWWCSMIGICGVATVAGYWYLKKIADVGKRLRWIFVSLAIILPLLQGLFRGHMPFDLSFGVLIAALIAISLCDISRRVVPNAILICVLPVAAVHIMLYNPGAWPVHLIVALIVGVFLGLISWIGKNSLGMGDVKLMAVISLFLGMMPAMTAFMIGTILSALYAVILLIRTRDKRREFAFAPFLAFGCIITIYIGI